MITNNKLLLSIVLCALALGIGLYISQHKKTPEEPIIQEEVIAPEGLPTFSWDLQYTDETEYPQTTLSLTATYENGVVLEKEIDTAQGSCNEYTERDVDTYAKSEMIICYYAGLGHYYKIVQSDTAFLVQRRVFEEASPEYNPPVLPFETIATF